MKIILDEPINMKDHVSVLKQKDGENIGYSESERQGTESSALLDKDGTVSSSLKGKSPQGEQDTLAVGQILIKVLNNSGDNWSKPELGDGVADCVAYDLDNPKKKIQIQVTRASTKQEFWRKLSTTGQIDLTKITIDELVSDLKISLDKKASEQVIPTNIRISLVLALDATRLPSHTLDRVINQFRDNFSEYAKSLGFHSIWIVGPWEVLTFRLDLNPSNNTTENIE